MSLRLAIECAAVFVLLPLVIAFRWIPGPALAVLLAVAIGAAAWLRGQGLWASPAVERERRARRALLPRAGVVLAALIALCVVLFRDRLLHFPRSSPLLWGALLVLYPIVSVYPQELVFRAFFLRRYRPLFGGIKATAVACVIAFAWMHVIYGNAVAPALSAAGGLLFTRTYLSSRSLRLVWLEHSLYGIAIFTFGLGDYFIYKPDWPW